MDTRSVDYDAPMLCDVVHSLKRESPDDPEFMIFCPGCKCGHWFKTEGKGPVWTFNGDMVRPTVSPSLLVRGMRPDGRCHSFIENGSIRFLNDCDHELAGKTVPLETF